VSRDLGRINYRNRKHIQCITARGCGARIGHVRTMSAVTLELVKQSEVRRVPAHSRCATAAMALPIVKSKLQAERSQSCQKNKSTNAPASIA
jgi:hypothetical protein